MTALDQRQRAMLQEMQVRVWWPDDLPAPQDSLAAAGPDPVAAVSTMPVRASPPARIVAPAGAPSAVMHGGADRRPADIDAMDWSALAHTVSTCDACQLCVGRKAAVFTAQPNQRQADWLVVGEPPDEQEERTGTAFAGPSGQLLDNMLRAVQRTRDGAGSAGARVTNVVKCRPGVVRNPQAEELAVCARYLRREITLTRPKLILAMGRFAAQSLLGTGHPELAGLPFGKLRGQVHHHEGIPVVVTYHPSRLLRAPDDKAAAWADLCLAHEATRAAT